MGEWVTDRAIKVLVDCTADASAAVPFPRNICFRERGSDVGGDLRGHDEFCAAELLRRTGAFIAGTVVVAQVVAARRAVAVLEHFVRKRRKIIADRLDAW